MLSTCQTKSVSMVSENISLWTLFLEAQLHSLLRQNFSHRPLSSPQRGKLLPESKICSREEGMKFACGKRIGKRSRDNSKTVMNNKQSSKNSGYFYKNICGNEEGEHQCHEVVKRQNAKWDSSINSLMTGGRYHIETSPSIDWFLYDNGLRH